MSHTPVFGSLNFNIRKGIESGMRISGLSGCKSPVGCFYTIADPAASSFMQ